MRKDRNNTRKRRILALEYGIDNSQAFAGKQDEMDTVNDLKEVDQLKEQVIALQNALQNSINIRMGTGMKFCYLNGDVVVEQCSVCEECPKGWAEAWAMKEN